MLWTQILIWGAGQYEDSQTSVVTDDAADEMSIQRGARIASFVSFTSVCSFYDAAGRIDGAHHPPHSIDVYIVMLCTTAVGQKQSDQVHDVIDAILEQQPEILVFKRKQLQFSCGGSKAEHSRARRCKPVYAQEKSLPAWWLAGHRQCWAGSSVGVTCGQHPQLVTGLCARRYPPAWTGCSHSAKKGK